MSYRDAVRSPPDRGDRNWDRDDTRVKSDRDDSFYRGRSPAYERPRRHRSRSPGDRYDYRDDRRRRPSPPPRDVDRYVPSEDAAIPLHNPVQAPMTLDYQVGFSYFGEWWRQNERIKEAEERQRTGKRRTPERPRDSHEAQAFRDKEKAKIQVAYDAYKEDLQAKMAKTFVQQHKDEQWFKERYVAEVRDPLRKQLAEHRRGAYTQWEQDLESGTFDDFTLEGVPRSERDSAAADKEEGEAAAVNEVLGVGDLVPASHHEIKDEQLFQPTLLIKTIAPSVSRANLEAFCKEHLGEEEGGYKWLSLSDPNPSKRYHRIGWIMLHPGAEILPSNDREEMAIDADSKEGEDEKKPVVPRSTADKALEAINGKTVKDEVRGDFVCHVGVHNPPINTRKKALWDLFSAPERIDKDLELAQKLVNKFEEDYGSDFNAILKVEEKVEELKNDGKLVAPEKRLAKVEEEEKKPRILSMDVAMDEDGEAEEGEEQDDEGMVDDEDDVDDQELLVKKKQLDLLIEYLRRVFSFCFFCVFESDSVHELTRKCPGGHLRRPRSTLSSTAKAVARASAAGEPFPRKQQDPDDVEEGEAPEPERKFSKGYASKSEQQLQRAFNWVRTFEEKIGQILEPESADLRKLGGRPVEEMLDEELDKYVKQEDEHKWRCKVPECTKLFKEKHFWTKHVEKRHPEWLVRVKDDLSLVTSYLLDPAHIAPSRTDANSNGHFPQANGQGQAGTPRGFNLQTYAMNQFVPVPGFQGMPNFPGGVTMPGWSSGNGTGPIRRGPGAMGASRAGPYDRGGWNPAAGGNGMAGGRPGMPGGMGRGGGTPGGARWLDGAGGGAGTTGPMEATRGRVLKSYEDLDANGGTGGGGSELNY